MIEVPERLKKLALSLARPLYVVGGTCRDALSGMQPAVHDWDVCAPVSAEELASAAEKLGFGLSAVYKNTGTVRLDADGICYEFTSFRSDKYVRGVHSPVEVCFTDDIYLDARRRDFKCNAVYFDVAAEEFVDPLGGIAEIKDKVISTVVSAEKVFGEDGLRLMRLCRIAAQTGFTPTKECLDGARKNCALIRDIAPERIWAELNAILHAEEKYGVKDGPYRGLELLKSTGVMGEILPELALGDKMEQRKDFHDYDVLEHSLRCVMYAPPQIRLAALLHDVGKPYCKINFGSSALHEQYGEVISKEICKRLSVPKKLAEFTARLVALHMYDLSGRASENKVRKFIVNNYDVFQPLLMLKQADYSACKDALSTAPCVIKWSKILKEMQEDGTLLTLKELAVNGAELINAGVPPEMTGKALHYLLEQTAMGCVANEKGKLVRHAQSFCREMCKGKKV